MHENLIAIVAQYVNNDTFLNLLLVNGSLSSSLLNEDTLRCTIGSLYNLEMSYLDILKISRYFRFYDLIPYRNFIIERKVLDFMQSLNIVFSLKKSFDYCIEILETDDVVLFDMIFRVINLSYTDDSIAFFINLHSPLFGPNILSYIVDKYSITNIDIKTHFLQLTQPYFSDSMRVMRKIYEILDGSGHFTVNPDTSKISELDNIVGTFVSHCFLGDLSFNRIYIENKYIIVCVPPVLTYPIEVIQHRNKHHDFILRIELESNLSKNRLDRILRHYGKIRGYKCCS